MKETLLSLLVIAFILSSCVQKEQTEDVSVTLPKQEYIEVPTFKLYPTENMWNFLKLNTATGQISIIQYTVNEDHKRFEYSLSDQILIAQDDTFKPGRFELTPTTNRWNFILLDHVTGQTYQVQWSFEEENRFVIPIY